jgi:hypothetical protein
MPSGVGLEPRSERVAREAGTDRIHRKVIAGQQERDRQGRGAAHNDRLLEACFGEECEEQR